MKYSIINKNKLKLKLSLIDREIDFEKSTKKLI